MKETVWLTQQQIADLFGTKRPAITKRRLESSTATRIERLEREKNDLLARLKAMLDMLHEKLKEAVRAFMEFSKSVLREFSIRHRDTIVEYLADSLDVRNAAHTLKVFARPFLDNRQFDKGSKD